MAAIEQSENLRKLLSLLTGYPKEIPLTYGTLAEAMRLARLVQAEIEAREEADKVQQIPHEENMMDCPHCAERRLHVR